MMMVSKIAPEFCMLLSNIAPDFPMRSTVLILTDLRPIQVIYMLFAFVFYFYNQI